MERSIKIEYSKTAATIIRHLPPSAKGPVRHLIEQLSTQPCLGKPLRDELEGYRSHRYNRYRVIYCYHEDKKLIEIIFAGQRADVYSLFSRYLKTQKKKQ
ncbi:MAG: hypothetical protein ACD_62C00357G0009 [uncultured bacterium]|nr:MAG: hypothetical protein ACD_62C00357G0009 [uncultured bacterium]HLD45019.1 type II toxin-antitoxin system RelE/ParE family toxin [bacterium]